MDTSHAQSSPLPSAFLGRGWAQTTHPVPTEGLERASCPRGQKAQGEKDAGGPAVPRSSQALKSRGPWHQVQPEMAGDSGKVSQLVTTSHSWAVSGATGRSESQAGVSSATVEFLVALSPTEQPRRAPLPPLTPHNFYLASMTLAGTIFALFLFHGSTNWDSESQHSSNVPLKPVGMPCPCALPVAY